MKGLAQVVLWAFTSLSRNTFRMSIGNKPSKEIYGIPGSGWTSQSWNWGSPTGTGHDCAAICRRRYANKEDRQALVQKLLNASPEQTDNVEIEELKLILGLTFQRGRWDGSDGGPGGFSDVLSAMAKADRYEDASDQMSRQRMLEDMVERYPLLLEGVDPSDRKQLIDFMKQNVDRPDSTEALRRCSGLVLQAMGFVQKGL